MKENPIAQDSGTRREFSRVNIYVPFEYRTVAREEWDHIQSKILGYSADTEWGGLPKLAGNDHQLGEWLNMLNTKLDRIIRLMTLQKEGYFGLASRAVNISGGGLSFNSSKEIRLGEVLEIKTLLTTQHSMAMVIYGQVTKAEKTEEDYAIAISYVRMDDLVRNEIIRFVFEREREIIRTKRR
ncbi:MAG: PilZ domain-containing protein [Syntrophaceae bacterium]|nr:PilZ domain-containing protein [Syntrophaceae bacterium]